LVAIHTPTPSTWSSLDIPRLQRQPDALLESVESFLKAQQSGIYKVFSDVEDTQFAMIELTLANSRARYDYNSRLQTLIIRWPSDVHDTTVQRVEDCFEAAMRRQEEQPTSAHYSWTSSTTFKSRVDYPGEGPEKKKSDRFIADYTIYDDDLQIYLIVEVAFSQSRDKAIQLIRERMKEKETIVGAIVIDLIESPSYHSPNRQPTSEDYTDLDEWHSIVQQSPPYGPIHRKVDQQMWIGSIRCTIDILFNQEEGLDVKKAIIIPEGDSLASVDEAFSKLWARVVNKVTHNGAKPVPFEMDWPRFRRELTRAIARTARGRHDDWCPSKKKNLKASDDDDLSLPTQKK